MGVKTEPHVSSVKVPAGSGKHEVVFLVFNVPDYFFGGRGLGEREEVEALLLFYLFNYTSHCFVFFAKKGFIKKTVSGVSGWSIYHVYDYKAV